MNAALAALSVLILGGCTASKPPGQAGSAGHPFQVSCAEGTCKVSAPGGPIAEVMAFHEDIVRPISGLKGHWLLVQSNGDGCPTMYQLICPDGGGFKASEAFGNCNEIERITIDGSGGLTVAFPEGPTPEEAGASPLRAAQEVRLNPAGCLRSP